MQRERSILCFWPGNDELFDQSYFKRFPKNTTRGYGVEIVIPIGDIDVFYERVRERVCVVDPLVKQQWGRKDFRVVDPFGYYIRCTEPYDVLDEYEG